MANINWGLWCMLFASNCLISWVSSPHRAFDPAIGGLYFSLSMFCLDGYLRTKKGLDN